MKPTETLPAPIAQLLADSGLRPTTQRETVYQVILDKRDHPTADEVFARVKEAMPTISLATVYNCLEALVQHELVRAVNFERMSTRYCPNLHPHAHFHDESGATLDIELPPEMLEKLRGLVPTGYSTKHIEINFHGRSGTN
jgi:Fur family peroxide stress response transcriptional regulator